MDGFKDFLLWEMATKDCIDVKKVYIDMAGDLVAGILLSQIVYWYLPSKDGNSKLRVVKDGIEWIAKERGDWWDEIRITPKQFDRAFDILMSIGIVEKEYYRFSGLRTMHIRLLEDKFLELFNEQIKQGVNPGFPKGKDRSLPKVKTEVYQRLRPGRGTCATTSRPSRGGPGS